MALKSDISINAPVFAPSAISEGTNAFNEKLMDIMSKGPKWYEVLPLSSFLSLILKSLPSGSFANL